MTTNTHVRMRVSDVDATAHSQPHPHHVFSVDLDTCAITPHACTLCTERNLVLAQDLEIVPEQLPTNGNTKSISASVEHACVSLHLQGLVRVLAYTRQTRACELRLRTLRLEDGAQFLLSAPTLRNSVLAGVLPSFRVSLDNGAAACLDGIRIMSLHVQARAGSQLHDCNALNLRLLLDNTSYVATSPQQQHDNSDHYASPRARSNPVLRTSAPPPPPLSSYTARRHSIADAMSTHVNTLHSSSSSVRAPGAAASACCYRFDDDDDQNAQDGDDDDCFASPSPLRRCLLCQEDTSDLLACQPCGHAYLCAKCATVAATSSAMRCTTTATTTHRAACPLCRQPIGALAMPAVRTRSRRASIGALASPMPMHIDTSIK